MSDLNTLRTSLNSGEHAFADTLAFIAAGYDYQPQAFTNGDVQNELVDLKVDSLDDWMTYKGKNVAVDVGIYAPQKNTVVYFIKKGTKPRLQGLTNV